MTILIDMLDDFGNATERCEGTPARGYCEGCEGEGTVAADTEVDGVAWTTACGMEYFSCFPGFDLHDAYARIVQTATDPETGEVKICAMDALGRPQEDRA